MTTLYSRWSRRQAAPRAAVALLLLAGIGLSGCAAHPRATPGVINAVAAESQYASLLTQLGGPYVAVQAVMTNPNSDPHSFEASTSVAEAVSQAQLVVENGLGYDTFIQNMEQASPSSQRRTISAQHVLGLPDSTPNPHLWYDTTEMVSVAGAITAALITLAPSHADYFRTALRTFDASMGRLNATIALDRLRLTAAHVRMAVTEPVADYLLQNLGVQVATPFRFQRDVMNGIDPAPQDVALEDGLLTTRSVAALVTNQQVVSAVTASVVQVAQRAHVPVVGVNETMPVHDTYQQWILATVQDLVAAAPESTPKG